MARIWCVFWGLVACGIAANTWATEISLRQMEQAPSKGPLRTDTVEWLRTAGPAGLERALASFDWLRQRQAQLAAEAERLSDADFEGNKDSILTLERQSTELQQRIDSLQAAIDRIGAQRGCSVSRLYWYTDLEAAKAESVRTGRPILSLRMLGKLTDEYSCANSRFFRTALYSNNENSEFMRTNFVLHWQSVRPVPRVTIDFGDGRKLERTLTGNSAHHVLASDGAPLDVLPGLYSPAAFRQWLATLRKFHERYLDTPAESRASIVQSFHQVQEDAVLRAWDLDIQRLGAPRAQLVSARINAAVESARLTGREVPTVATAPNAAAAAKAAVGKTAVEAPMLRFANLGGTWMERGMDDDLWQAVANLHRSDVKLDEASVAMVRKEFPAAVAMRAAVSKTVLEDPVLRMVRAFEDSMTLDTVRNEYLLHRRIHEQFAGGNAVTADVGALNEWVYAELFLTPSSDPWLGLAPNDVYTALENDGRTEPARGAERSGG